MPPRPFSKAIPRRRWPSFDRLVMQMMLNVCREVIHRRVAQGPVFLQTLHDDPVEFTRKQLPQPTRIAFAVVTDDGCGLPQGADAFAGQRWFFLTNDAPHLV